MSTLNEKAKAGATNTNTNTNTKTNTTNTSTATSTSTSNNTTKNTKNSNDANNTVSTWWRSEYKTGVRAQSRLLDAFAKLEDHITLGSEKRSKEKVWQLYVTSAARRFNMYVSALKVKFPKKTDLQELKDHLEENIPPLDVLMIWYYFMRDPGAFYATFMVDDFEQFTNCAFPLVKAAEAIDKNLIFKVDAKNADKVMNLVEGYLRMFEVKEMFKYDAYSYFDPTMNVPIFCVNCGTAFGWHPLTTHQSTGFADVYFELKNTKTCNCLKHYNITHDRLRNQIFVRDVNATGPFYPASKTLGFTHSYNYSNDSLRKEKVCLTKKLGDYTLSSIRYTSRPSVHSLLVLKTYSDINPISATIAPSNRILIREDLVAMVLKERGFPERDSHSWFTYPYEESEQKENGIKK